MARRVLLGFADSLAALESAWSLEAHGFEVVAFTRQGIRPPLALRKSVTVVDVTPPEEDAEACVRDLADVIGRFEPVAVLPLDDQAVWVCSRTKDLAPIAGPVGEAARFALDKSEQFAAARDAGFAVPVEGDKGPWMVKPTLAVVEADGRLQRPTGTIARTPDEVEAAKARIAGPVVVQRAVTGVGEGVFGIATEGGVEAWSAHRRIRMMNPRGSGSSACRSIPVSEPLRVATERLIGGLGWRGLFMVEVLRDDAGTPWFMEVNGRPWGSMALAVGRGLHYPAWAVELALDPGFRPPIPEDSPHRIYRHLGREIVHLAAVMRGAKGSDAGRWPGRLETLRAMRPRRGDRWYNWRRGEARVLLRDAWATVASQLKG